jgi:uncharacterized FlaG/YvyC family protein
MDTGSIRPVSSVAEAIPTRPSDPQQGVATQLAAAQAVQSAATSEQTGTQDQRHREMQDRVDIAASPILRQALSFDDATRLAVMRKIREPNTVVDQIPSEAYLRMRAALQEAVDASSAHEHADVDTRA